MPDGSFLSISFFIFAGAAVFATLALYARQALIVAYILVGVLLGPSVSGLLVNPELIAQVSQAGIMFLLFLLGLNLHPQRLLELLRTATVVTLVSALLFAALGAVVAYGAGFTLLESAVVGAAMMFSSTILGLKLLPTTVLHHRHAGGVVISVLLLQDLIAILVLLLIQGFGQGEVVAWQLVLFVVALPVLMVSASLFERFVLIPLFQRFDQIQEYIFLVSIGWCLGMAKLAEILGLPAEIGSFIAGVAIATHPISRYIADSLKPVRDFFLVMFFVALGAGFDLNALSEVFFAGCALALAILIFKPLVFRILLRHVGESGGLPWEIGIRLGQASEFSLLIAYLAHDYAVIGARAAYLIQFAMLLTFIISAYWIVLRYPTPIAVSDQLRKD